MAGVAALQDVVLRCLVLGADLDQLWLVLLVLAEVCAEAALALVHLVHGGVSLACWSDDGRFYVPVWRADCTYQERNISKSCLRGSEFDFSSLSGSSDHLGQRPRSASARSNQKLALNLTDFGIEPQAAVEASRFASYSYPRSDHPHPYAPGVMNAEARIPEDVIADLARRGHKVEPWPDFTPAHGRSGLGWSAGKMTC